MSHSTDSTQDITALRDALRPRSGEPGPAAEPVAELTPFLDALRVPDRLRPGAEEALRGIEIRLTATWTRLHPQLPPTKVWTYNGHFPGPTIEVPRGRRLRVAWTNRLTGAYPVTAVEVRPTALDPRPSETPGYDRTAGKPREDVAALPPWSVTHLHGARTGGGNDGWAENAVAPGDSQLSEYPNDHRATAWWYHDHAMDITRWNVFTGLVGMYLVRDAEEAALRLPDGAHEVPLIIADRNVDRDEDGHLTGRLLHKTQLVGPADAPVALPFSGPYTTVNGVVWPHFDVEARWYRFRVLNASNARLYELQLRDDETGEPVPGVVWQIGSDGGLLPKPVPLDEPLKAAPAERMDLLIDFRELRGRKLRLVNASASAGPYPQVMQFRVGTQKVRDRFVLPDVVSPSFRRITHDNVPGHDHRMVVLTPAGAGHPEIWEMVKVDPATVAIPSDGVIQIDNGTQTSTYRRIARSFDDALGFMAKRGGWEQWSFLNLANPAPMHPMHIHLIDFQVLSRDVYDVSRFDAAVGGTLPGLPITLANPSSAPIAPNEQGWKDVIQVPGRQMVNVIGEFTGASGRFMYHCHILEHEDEGMMRPFVVMPEEVLRFHHGMGGGDHPH